MDLVFIYTGVTLEKISYPPAYNPDPHKVVKNAWHEARKEHLNLQFKQLIDNYIVAFEN